jgi:hypothetical protein
MRGKRDSAVRWESRLAAQPATASESALSEARLAQGQMRAAERKRDSQQRWIRSEAAASGRRRTIAETALGSWKGLSQPGRVVVPRRRAQHHAAVS